MIPEKTIEELITRHSSLEKDLASGKVDKKIFAEKSKEYSDLNEIVNSAKKYASYKNDKRYEQISLLIAEATVEYAPKDFICKILIQTFDSIDNPSAKFVKRINQFCHQSITGHLFH